MEINLIVKSFHCFINLKRGLEYMMMTMRNSISAVLKCLLWREEEQKHLFNFSEIRACSDELHINLFAYFIIPRHNVINNSNRTNFSSIFAFVSIASIVSFE